MGLLRYWLIKLLKKVEMIRNRHQLSWFIRPPFRPDIQSWIGLEYIYLHHDKKQKIEKIKKYYAQVKGQTQSIQIHDHRTLSYDDHLPRIRTPERKIETACFHKPHLSADEYVTHRIVNPSHQNKLTIQTLVKQYPYLAHIPKPFQYSEMEADKSLLPPAPVGLPEEFTPHSNFVFNQNHQLTENVLHLPIKPSFRSNFLN